MVQPYENKHQGVRKEFTKDTLKGTFTFKMSVGDFKDEEETNAFFLHLNDQKNISNYLKSSVIVNFRRERMGETFEVVEKALERERVIKQSGIKEDMDRIMKYIDLYGTGDLITVIDQKGKPDHSEMVDELMKRMTPLFQGVQSFQPAASAPEVTKTATTATDLDFDD